MCSTFIFLSVVLSHAFQEQPTEPHRDGISPVVFYQKLMEADALFAKNEFDKAVTIYSELATHDPDNGKLYEMINSCHTELGNRQAAANAALQMARLGHGNQARVYYQIARNHGLNDETEQAFEWLERSLAARFEERPRIQNDRAFRSMRDDPRFSKIAGTLPERPFTRDEGWQYDLKFFADEVVRLGAGPEQFGTTDEFAAMVADVSRRVSELSNEQIAFEIQQLAVSLGNGHSMVYPMPTERVRITQLPVQLYVFPDGLFVVGGKGSAAELTGHKVLAIGSKDADSLMEDLKTIVHRDNDFGILWMGPMFLAIPEVLQFLGAVENTDDVPFDLEDLDGNRKTVELQGGRMSRPKKLGPAGSKDEAPLYLQQVSDPYWFRPLPNLNAIYVQYNQVVSRSEQPIEAFADSLRQAIADSRPDHLIVDLRHNNGGDPDLFQSMVPPLVFFEMLDKNNRLYVITGRNTFSAAQNFLNALEAVTHPIIVGEPSSGRPNSVGEESQVVLPWSGLNMSIACRYWQDSSPTDHRRWIPPHIPVKLTSSDYFSNRDPAMEAIEQIIGSQSSR